MPTITAEQRQGINLVVDAIEDTVKAAGPLGAPSGIIFAALQQHGASLAQYNSIMDIMVRKGRLTREGHLYFIPKKPAA